MKNITPIVEQELCCSCRACGVVCHESAIAFEYFPDNGMFHPVVNTNRCISCGKCVSVCPSSDIEMPTDGKRTPIGKQPIGTYAAFAKDFKTRWNSTSGGVVSAMVKKLLSDRAYKRAYVVAYDSFDGETQAELKSISAESEVNGAAKSKYVPVSVASVVKDIRDKNVANSIVVCTPCQLKAIRVALEQYGEPEENVLFIGIFCERMFNYKIYGHYEKEYGHYDKLYFREKEPDGWPGHTTLINGDVRTKIDRNVRMSLKKVYPVKRCDWCNDKLNVAADISVGDCYVKGFETPDGRGGVSNVVVRTEKGNRAFSICKDVLDIRELEYDLVRASQSTVPLSECDSRVYNVLVNIASLTNRGDWLMFEATLEQVRGRLPNAVVYVSQNAYVKTPKYFVDRRILPLIDPSAIDLMLFAPGFRFSDQTGVLSEEFARRDAQYFSTFSKPGRKMVFLPQAFGPFENEYSAMRVRGATEPADLIFAREKTSYDYLAGTIDRLERLSIAPDFTSLYHPEKSETPYPRGSYAVIIPNMRMIDRSDAATAERYREFSVKLLKALLEKGEKVILLNHEGPGDTTLLNEFNEATGGACKIVDDVSGGTCKSIISGAKLVVTSRFHGFVSALSERVPAFCTSWSHKYQELADEFGCGGSCLSLLDVDAAVQRVMDGLSNPDAYRATACVVAKICAQIQDMWDKVFALAPAWAKKSMPINGRIFDVHKRIIGSLSADLKAKKAKVEELRSVLANREAKIAELRGQRENLTAKVEELRGQRGDLAAKVEELRGQRGDLTAKVEELRGQRGDLAAKVEELRAVRADREAKIAELRGQRENLTAKVDELRGQRENLTAKVNALRGQRENLAAKVEEFRISRENRDAKITELRATCAERAEKLKKAQSQRHELDKKVERLTKELSSERNLRQMISEIVQ